MKNLILFALIAGLVLAVGTAQALTTQQIDYKAGTVMSGGGGFVSWTASDLNENGTPYWDNISGDGSQKNIGYQLTSTGGGSMQNPPGALPFLVLDDDSDGNDIDDPLPTDWYFKNHSTFATLRFELAGRADINEFGWYQVDSSGNKVANTETPIFSGAESPVKSKTVGLPAGWEAFGLYLKTSNGVIYYSQSTYNPSGEGSHQHFALFRQTPGTWANARWWIGVEDLSIAEMVARTGQNEPKYEGWRGDYNDMIVTMEAIPDASTWMLFLSGVPALTLLRRRKG